MDDSGWQTLYLSALEETKKLKKQIRTLETILREHLPVIGWDDSYLFRKKNDKK